ncbi:hypothetical protein Pelo_19692 [Pelomyxa schiedti]|nr:hypothetical protein Pelo_19692 [Pelomyxa schiedti]
MAHLCDVAPTCCNVCDSPETMKHILNSCGHHSDLRCELNANPHKILNVIPNSPDSAKTAAKTLVGLYNFHTSTLPQELAPGKGLKILYPKSSTANFCILPQF